MRITQQAIEAFLVGAGIGSIVTYWMMTREKRLISRIRQEIDWLAAFHNLTDSQYRRTLNSKELVSDEDVLAYYQLGHKIRETARRSHRNKKLPIQKISPVQIAAESIICEKILGLTVQDGIRALSSAKSLDDLKLLGVKNSN